MRSFSKKSNGSGSNNNSVAGSTKGLKVSGGERSVDGLVPTPDVLTELTPLEVPQASEAVGVEPSQAPGGGERRSGSLETLSTSSFNSQTSPVQLRSRFFSMFRAKATS
jgi:hypothetical protein